MEEIKKQLKKSLIEFSILTIISSEEVYASEILERLKAADFIVVEGTLYPLLSRLRTDEIVSYRWEESQSGPPRKYYKLTKKGLERLSNYTKSWKDISKSINLLINSNEKSNTN
jgi:PadR family transcriptional regulator PadR